MLSFSKNLILLNKLNSNGYTWKYDDGILKVICGSRVILQEKKCRGHYLLIGSPIRGGIYNANRSPVRDRVLEAGGSDMRQET